jgi:tRNA (cmo5U34)-methyltransferase
MGSQWHFDPVTYLAVVRREIAGYDDLEAAVADATRDVTALRVLDLGTGTGVTAEQVLAVHPEARLVAIDASAAMLEIARSRLPGAELRVQDLSDPLPPGPFELVVSAFAVHHLHGPGKADLFRRIARELAPGGRFVLCDVVVPVRAVPAPGPLDPELDRPSSVAGQLDWLRAAGLEPSVVQARDDLAILAADRPAEP